MTYVRLGFLGALLLLLVGGYTVRNAVAPYFSTAGELPSPSTSQTPTARVEARKIVPPSPTAIIVTATPTARPSPTAIVVTAAPTATPTARVVVVTPAPVVPRHQRVHGGQRTRRLIARPTATAIPTLAPTATVLPTSTPVPTTATETVALSNYWVNTQTARPGQSIAIAYVIRNNTGRTERIMLGASLKPRSTLSWTAAINDPYHDVVAMVPPGATVHVRYFTLPSGLHPGAYDVAWGLRDAATGRRLGLAFAPSVVTVTR